jgi:hypothetical protein
MVVGQETHGWYGEWNSTASIPETLKVYDSFHLGLGYNSPFWEATRRLRTNLKDSVPEFGFVWANLFSFDQNKGRADENYLEAMRKMRVLPKEIEILKPHAVIFFTGPVYEYNLNYYFPGESIGDRRLARLVRERLPTLSFRTYHPNYLKRSKQLNGVVDEISLKIAAGLEADPSTSSG